MANDDRNLFTVLQSELEFVEKGEYRTTARAPWHLITTRESFFASTKITAPNQPPPNTHSVQHFWLCGACSLRYTLEYREDRGVILHSIFEKARQSDWNRSITAAG